MSLLIEELFIWKERKSFGYLHGWGRVEEEGDEIIYIERRRDF